MGQTHFIAAFFLCAVVLVTPVYGQADPSPQTKAGWDALNAGNADRAASLFFEALSHVPKDPFALFGAGVAAHLLGRDRDAVVSLARAVEIDRRLTDASLLLGELQYQLGDVESAVRTYEQAAIVAPRERAIQERLTAWRKEAAAHRSMETWSNGSFSVIIDGRSDRELAARALDILDKGYARIGAAIGAYPPGRIVVTLYTDEQFRDFTASPDWSDGVFDGRIRMPVGGVSKDPARFERVLTHELVHAMVAGLAPQNIPAWLHEGLASYFEPIDRAPVERMLKLVPMIPLTRLQQGFGRLSAAQARFAYSESLIVAAIVFERLGARTSVLIWALGNGQTLDTAWTSLGLSYADFEASVKRKFGTVRP